MADAFLLEDEDVAVSISKLILDRFAVDHASHPSSILRQQHLRLRLKDIENYVGDDPLQPWLRCIEWASDAFPADSSDSCLRHLLYLCTKLFSKDERYLCDIRFLRIWIRYADFCPVEDDMFLIMEANQIGQDHSLFYEAYATYLEIRRNFSKANEIYKRGISRKAQPLESLENMHKSFLERMAKRADRHMMKKAGHAVWSKNNSGFDSGKKQAITTLSPASISRSLHPLMEISNTGRCPSQDGHGHVAVTFSECKTMEDLFNPVGSCNKGIVAHKHGWSNGLKPFVDECFRVRDSTNLWGQTGNSVSHPGFPKGDVATTPIFAQQVLAHDTSLFFCNGIEKSFEEVRMQIWSQSRARVAVSLPTLADGYTGLLGDASHQQGCLSQQVQGWTLKNSSTKSEMKHLSKTMIAIDGISSTFSSLEQKTKSLDGKQCSDQDGEHQSVSFRSSRRPLYHDSNDNLGGHDKAQQTNKSCRGASIEAVAIKQLVEADSLSKDYQNKNTELMKQSAVMETTIDTKEVLAEILSMFSGPLPLQDLQLRGTLLKGEKHLPSPARGLQVCVDKGIGFQNRGKQEGGCSNIEIANNVCNESFNLGLHDEESRRPLKRASVRDTDFWTAEMEKFELSEESSSKNLRERCNNIQEDRFHGAMPSSRVNPWDNTILNNLLNNLIPPLLHYKGFQSSSHKYNGATSLSSRIVPHNKILELGTRRYHLKGCTGQGAFAQVFKAYDEQDNDKIVAVKIQKPACPWEYYIYSQLDKRISPEERPKFGRAWKMHSYSDCSIMVCAYGEHGTLQDVVNSYLATGQRMDELLCMYYTVEMLRMLEVLHSAGLIHGDIKPDNLLIRHESEILEDWAPDRPGCWKDQGLCLIDWGRSIDVSLFPPSTEFEGDCKTSGFRCIEMQQKRPWTYQIDTYGLCCIVHTMLHGSYMEIEVDMDDGTVPKFRPKAPFKRYHNRDLWTQFFDTLLNIKSCKDNPPLLDLRRVLEEYLVSNAQFAKKLKNLMVRQSIMMSSRK